MRELTPHALYSPLLTFAAIALLSGTAALFLVEVMSSIEGNERFQASIEFTTIAHLFLGKRWHLVVQGLLYLAMQTLVIASLLVSFQVGFCFLPFTETVTLTVLTSWQSMDAFLISVAHKTCAVSFTDGWVCGESYPPCLSVDVTSLMYIANQISSNSGSAFSGYILGSFGTLVSTVSHLEPCSLMFSVDCHVPNPPSQSHPPRR